jgi:hypothetical protein
MELVSAGGRSCPTDAARFGAESGESESAPQQDRFQQLRAEKKHFLDAIKLIAYRAKTTLAQLAREKIHSLDDGSSLIRQVFSAEVHRFEPIALCQDRLDRSL